MEASMQPFKNKKETALKKELDSYVKNMSHEILNLINAVQELKDGASKNIQPSRTPTQTPRPETVRRSLKRSVSNKTIGSTSTEANARSKLSSI